MSSPRKLSILIPVYNERFTIERVVEAAQSASLPDGVERELIVIDDGSSDGTSGILCDLDRTAG